MTESTSTTSLTFAAGLVAGTAAGCLAWHLLGGLNVLSGHAGAARRSAGGAYSDDDNDFDLPGVPDRVLRKAETVLARRTKRIVVVVERCTNEHNYSAVIRTAEALGIQHLWLISPPSSLVRAPDKHKKDRWEDDEAAKHKHAAFAQMASKWVTIREFDTTVACLEALAASGRQIWVTDLGQGAIPLSVDANFAAPVEVPEKMAIVFGSEAVGCSDTMLKAAHRRVYLPLHGFADSLNLSVAAALMVQQILIMTQGEAVGDLTEVSTEAGGAGGLGRSPAAWVCARRVPGFLPLLHRFSSY